MNPTMSDKQYSVCFSGHRLHKIIDFHVLSEIQARLACVVQEYVQKGFHTFYVGMADGFDMMAAEEVARIKSKESNIRFVAVIPSHNWRTFTNREKEIFAQADEIIAVADRADKKSYHKRNRSMVDHASVLICYYNGATQTQRGGGTAYTVRYAEENGLEIVNIF